MDLKNLEEKVLNKQVQVAVFGLGRIGLPTALMFTKGGYNVVGVDINTSLLHDLENKNTFIDEPGLPELLNNAVDNKLIVFTNNFEEAVKKTDVMVVCVPTPVNENKVPEYRAIESVSREIGKRITPGKIVIIESSISPTTIRDIIIPIIEGESNLKVNEDIGVCSCPERADPGKIVENFNKVVRIIGSSSDEVGKVIIKLYQNITDAEIVHLSTPGTANAVKLTENIFRDVNIALINELAILYEKLGIDVKEVIKGASTKYNFQPHFPGPGVGGPCLPANPYYIIQDAEKVDYIPFLIRVAREVNDRMPEYVLELITDALNHVEKCIKGSKITVLGLSYKANVRDIQISPSVKVVKLLQSRNADLRIWDPYYKGELVDGMQVSESFESAIEGTECIIVLTDHNEFKDLDYNVIQKKTSSPLVLVDSRDIYEKENIPSEIVYCGVGRNISQ